MAVKHNASILTFCEEQQIRKYFGKGATDGYFQLNMQVLHVSPFLFNLNYQITATHPPYLHNGGRWAQAACGATIKREYWNVIWAPTHKSKAVPLKKKGKKKTALLSCLNRFPTAGMAASDGICS